MGESDQELIQLSLAGDQNAFAVILSRYKKTVYNIIYHLVRDPQETNDLFQETFIKIYKSLITYNPDLPFGSWTAKIATNVCLDRLRQRQIPTIPVERIAEVSDNRATPEESYQFQERTERIQKAIKELPEKYRIPIVLFHLQNLTYEEMAHILNLPITIIKNRLYRARLLLREELTAKEESL